MATNTIGRTLKGAYTVWYRDVLALLRDRARLTSTVVMSLIMLGGLGFGLGGVIGKVGGSGGIPGVPYIQFAFPAFLCMGTMMTGLQSTMSLVWDREFGFMRKILVAPVSRISVALGKVAGGITVAVIQGAIIMLALPFIGMPVRVLPILGMLLVLVLLSAAMTALGILVAARQKSMQAFQTISMFVMMPLMLLSFGSFLPSFGNGRIAQIFKLVSQINPAQYGVDAMRQITLGSALPASMTLHSPVVDAFILLALTAIFLAPGVALFSKQD